MLIVESTGVPNDQESSSHIAVPQREPQDLRSNRIDNGRSILVIWSSLTRFEVQSCEFFYRIRYNAVINQKRQETSGVVDVNSDQSFFIIKNLQPELAYDIQVTAAAIAVGSADPVEGPAAQMRVTTGNEGGINIVCLLTQIHQGWLAACHSDNG